MPYSIGQRARAHDLVELYADQARLAYQEALLLTENRVERDYLAGRLALL